jgi:hypothetical protein
MSSLVLCHVSASCLPTHQFVHPRQIRRRRSIKSIIRVRYATVQYSTPHVLGMSTFTVVDKEIASLYLRIRQLRTHRNTLTSFLRLPTELIIRIVEMTQAFSWSNERSHTWRFPEPWSYNSRWWQIMLVCTRLRSIIINAPELWTLIDCNKKEEWNQLCEQRAKARTYALRTDAGHASESLMHVTRLLRTAHTLHVQGVSRLVRSALDPWPLLERSAPCLRSLLVHGSILDINRQDIVWQVDPAPRFFITSSFLSGSCNLLRTLNLSGSCHAWRSYARTRRTCT